MKTKQEIRDWLLENAVDEDGNLYLIGLDFSDFDGDIYINDMKVKNNLYQNYQKVGKSLRQDFQKVAKSLCQAYQEVGENLYQAFQEVGKDLYQDSQEVGENFRNHKLESNEYWEEKEFYVVRRKKLKEITLEELEKMGYKLKEGM